MWADYFFHVTYELYSKQSESAVLSLVFDWCLSFRSSIHGNIQNHTEHISDGRCKGKSWILRLSQEEEEEEEEDHEESLPLGQNWSDANASLY